MLNLISPTSLARTNSVFVSLLLFMAAAMSSGELAAKEPANTPAKEETPKSAPEAPPAEAKPDTDGTAEEKPVEEKPTDEAVAVAKPVSGDLVRVYGWRETVHLVDVELKLTAKLDTGALTSSIHAEDKELFERDGKKWVRFVVSDPNVEKPVKHKIEAPLVRVARIKEPGGEPEHREVIRLAFQIGERKLRGQFTLNNRGNMLAPVLLGRSIIQDLGWVDASRTDLADENILR